MLPPLLLLSDIVGPHLLTGGWQVFADGFAGAGPDPEYRPTGLAVGPDGLLTLVRAGQALDERAHAHDWCCGTVTVPLKFFTPIS